MSGDALFGALFDELFDELRDARERAEGPDQQEPVLPDEEAILETMRRLEGGRLAESEAAEVEGPERDALRATLADVADAVAWAEDAPCVLKPAVGAAARGAWRQARELTLVSAPDRVQDESPALSAPRVRTDPLRGAYRPRRRFPLQVAALLLLGLAVGLFFASGSDEREGGPGVRLAAVYRVDLAAGRQEVASGRWVRPHEAVEAGPDEVVGLRLADGSTVTIASDGRIEMGETSFLVSAGRACVEAGPFGGRLALAGGGALEVEHGSGSVSADREFALDRDATGTLVRPDGLRVPLVGPVRVALVKDDSTGRLFHGEVRNLDGAADVFGSLAFFRVDHGAQPTGRIVGGRRWRTPDGGVRRTGHRLHLSPVGEERTARVAWRPSPSVREARTLDVMLDAPPGTRVCVPALGVETEVEALPVRAERRTIALALPADWYAQLDAGGHEMVIEITWPEDRHDAVLFEGTTFLEAGPQMETTRG